MKNPVWTLLAGALLSVTVSHTVAQTVTTCPADLLEVAQCYNGTDQNGATYWIAVPEKWNNTLVMHAHGGPRLGAIDINDSLEDLERFSVTVRQGFAWAGSSYRRPGYGVRMAAEDTENLRKIFVQAFGKPAHTILHGQSWGGNVAAKGIELYGVDTNGAQNYDGVVLTNGMLAGGTRNYLHRADLRAVYQYYCKNHPRPGEPQYPLWMGLPPGPTMSAANLRARVNECTGVGLAPEQRSDQQKRNLQNILGVIKVPERTLVSHLTWATNTFQDLIHRVLGGKNPFSNRHVVYQGSMDDQALNAGIERFSADPEAVRQLSHDSDMTGKIGVPVVTLHAIHDPTALIEYENAYEKTVTSAGQTRRLLQVFTTESEHSKLADAEYAAVFESLMRWVTTSARPAPEEVVSSCQRQSYAFSGGCHFDTVYRPDRLFSRVAPRNESFVPMLKQ